MTIKARIPGLLRQCAGKRRYQAATFQQFALPAPGFLSRAKSGTSGPVYGSI
ncbi:hypothetical protein [Mesorhizobium sp.]|uniref:hypothetical protein n=1 Tax=Mesorhizobium sp. TaxID=1871066 RepID=UPI0025B90D32|nr:hypothetical protein [Mesorhizobium sp.]